MPTLLVIDDEESVCYSFRRAFEGESVRVLTAQNAAAGLAQVHEHQPDVVVLDIQLPDRSGLDLFRDIYAENPKRPVIFITAHATTDTAIEAMKAGAFDYLIKPAGLERLLQVVQRAFDTARLMSVPARLPAEETGDRIVGRSTMIQEMSKAIGRLAPQDVNVLILGESGVGKELVARALYHHSRRADRPFLAINCAAIPETLLESELFGHERGAFTGADRKHIGKFEQCSGGTLFLDEIGDMAPGLQAKMLRVLQDQCFQRIGGHETIRTSVRILAATNYDLAKLVEEGRFRKDLYYRLNVVSIQVPTLRERLDDVAELAHYFLFRFDRELNLDLRGFSPETLEILQTYTWPGNVRELQSVVKQAMLNASGHIVLPEFLPEVVLHAVQGERRIEDRGLRIENEKVAPSSILHPPSSNLSISPTPLPPISSAGFDLDAMITSLLVQGEKGIQPKIFEMVERLLLTRVLRHTHGHQSQASEVLGLNRTTLRNRLRALGLTLDKVLVPGQDGKDEDK